MIVEDTPDLREFLVKNFEDIYDVLSAKNGAEALAILLSLIHISEPTRPY